MSSQRAPGSAHMKHRPFSREEIEQSIYSRFAEQVGRFPERLAISTPRHRWTYAEVSERVDALASALLRRCGQGEGRVALLFDHDAPMCAGILAALRASKAYVPLDPEYPENRLEAMLFDSAAQVILAERSHVSLANRLSREAIPIVVAEDATGTGLGRFLDLGPQDMAYILYTSGSTGRPKGVVQNQRNVLHFIRAYTNNLRLSPDDRLTLFSSYSFDAAVMAIFGALLNGACLFPRSIRNGGFRDLPAWIRESRISIYHSTPTVYRHFISACGEGDRFEFVRRVVLGGEPVVRRDVEAFKRHFGRGAVMVNGLGPTESTVTLQHFIDHETELTANAVPVGKPVCDTSVVLLDETGKESLTSGELTFISEHLALGYWQRPDLDAQVFGTYPTVSGGQRCYRSGDFGRWRPDGTLEFLGRKDFQVKIHGVRVELAEVEGAVEQQPGVAQCIAIAIPVCDGNARLVAYVRAAAGRALDSSRIREGVRALLPEAMVPSIVIPVDDFPMTPTGKVDRLALSDNVRFPLAIEPGQPGSFRSDTERRLAVIWCRLLGRASVGSGDDFFSIGGDSLAAVRLADEMEEAFSRKVALGRLFELRTLGALAAAIEAGSELGYSHPAVVPLRYGEAGGVHLFCICGVQLYQKLADAIGGPHRVSGVFLPVEEKVLSGADLPRLSDLAAMYGEVVRAEQPHGPYHLAGVSFGGMLAFELARQLLAQRESVNFLAVFDTALPQTIRRAERWKAHASLALRYGPRYILKKAGRKLGRLSSREPRRRSREGEVASDSGAPNRADPGLVRDRVYTEALDAYRRAMPSYDGDLHFFRASEEGEFEKEVVPLDYHWSRFARRCHAQVIPGGHLTILGPPGVSQLGRVVRDVLDGCVRATASATSEIVRSISPGGAADAEII